MSFPKIQSPDRGGSWIARLVVLVGIIAIGCIVEQEVSIMRSHLRKSFIALAAASLARHSTADSTVDLSWHAPNSTVINNLTSVIGSSGVYGFIYNSSASPADEYGIYNWCNMPHVRATEYKKPSPEYKLQYVEVVSCLRAQ